MIAFNIDDRRVHWGLELDESEDRSIPLKMTSSQKKKKTNSQDINIPYENQEKQDIRKCSIFKFRLTMKDIKLGEVKII